MFIRFCICSVLSLALTIRADRESPLWSTYRPHALVSVRAQVPHSPIFGLIYHPLYDPQLRHLASDQPSAIRSFSWRRHDGFAGEQNIQDVELNLNVTTYFVQEPLSRAWAIRFSVQPLDSGKSTRPISVVFYAASAPETRKAVRRHLTTFKFTEKVSKNTTNSVTLDGQDKAVGAFRLRINPPTLGSVDSIPSAKEYGETDASRTWLRSSEDSKYKSHDNLNRFFKAGMRVSKQIASMVEAHLTSAYDLDVFDSDGTKLLHLDNQVEDDASIVFVQRILQIPCSIDATFFHSEKLSESELGEMQQQFNSETITEMIARKQEAFDDRFERVFGLSKRGVPTEEIQFAKDALSNVLGGIGFFHGSSSAEVKSSAGSTSIKRLPPVSLLTATPSRSTFPRGFLWDEGFHQLVVQRWNEGLSEDCLRSWLSLMQKSGWIPREQILGLEASIRFPSHVSHLMIQKQYIANPPTLFLPLRVRAALALAVSSGSEDRSHLNNSHRCSRPGAGKCSFDGDTGSACSNSRGSPTSTGPDIDATPVLSATSKEFITAAVEKLSVYFDWLRAGQAGTDEDTFRWRGRSLRLVSQGGDPLTLASGLDDYPRSSKPNDAERHVDLHAWMTWAAGALAEMTRSIGGDAERFETLHKRWKLKLREKYLYKPSALSLQKNTRNAPLLCDYDGSQSSCHEGYVTLLPFMLGLLEPDDELVGSSLDALEREDILWSPAGVRSLSVSDAEYGRGDNYWTGPVWMPFNFLTLASLRTKYSVAEGPYRERSKKLFVRLRDTVLSNAFKEYKRTGFLWENYSGKDGSGRSGRQFTGWSALILLIYADMYQGVVL